MISALVACALSVAPIRIAEVPVPGEPNVIVQAYVSAPIVTQVDAMAWQLLGESLLAGTEEFTRERLLAYGAQAGYLPQVTVMPDHLRVEFILPKSALDLAVQLMESVLVRPRLRPEAIADARTRLLARRIDVWADALDVSDYQDFMVKDQAVRDLHLRAFRPERVVIAVGGGVEPGQGQAEVSRRFAGWNPPAAPPVPRYDEQPRFQISRPGEVASFEFRGNPLTPATRGSGAQMLAVFALGVGKDSALTRIAREQMGISYIQEGVLWPTAEGWEPRLIVLHLPPAQDVELSSVVRDALLKDIDTWDEETLSRARALAMAALLRDLAVSPFWLGMDQRYDATLRAKIAWAGYLTMIGSGSVEAPKLASVFENIELTDIQRAASAFVTNADTWTIRAGGRG